MTKVKDLMKTAVITIDPDEPIINAIKTMETGNFRRLPVVKDSKLIGIITDRDLRQATNSPVVFHETSYDKYLLNKINVGSCMTRKPITVNPDTDLAEAARIMEHEKIDGLPVLENDTVVGIITTSDLINHLIKILGK